MIVYLLIHDDRDRDTGDAAVRGVFADEASARASIVTLTPSGARSTAYDAHSEACCVVESVEVMTAPVVDYQTDPPTYIRPSAYLVPASVAGSIATSLTGRPARCGWRDQNGHQCRLQSGHRVRVGWGVALYGNGHDPEPYEGLSQIVTTEPARRS